MQWPEEEGQTIQWPEEEGQTIQWPEEKIQDKKLDGKIKIDQHESKVEVEVRKRRLSVIVYFTLRSFG